MKRIYLLALLLIAACNVLAQNLSLIKDLNVGSAHAYPRYLVVQDNTLYFSLGTTPGKLYSSDGTSVGTREVGPSAGSGTIWHLTPSNSTLYFSYDDGTHGGELWKSNGTTTGTVLVKDIGAGSESTNPTFLTDCNGKLFFWAPSLANNKGLWVTDGTNAGTINLNVIATPIGHSTYEVFNNKIYFSGNTGSGYGLWQSDGTVAGTQLIKSGFTLGPGTDSWAIHNGKMYFGFQDNTTQGLWVSDGTTAGTQLVKALVNVAHIVSANNKIYFSAFDNTHGDELWVSDGTSAGTTLVKDIFPGAANSSLRNMFVYKNEVYFFTVDGALYKTDGTSGGTIQLKGAGSYPNYPPIEFNGKLYWFDTAGNQNGLMYESDGTSAGTKAIVPQVSVYGNEKIAVVYKSAIYLAANYASQGIELCKFTMSAAVITIASHPTTQTVCTGSSVSLTASANGASNLSYRWQKFNGTTYVDLSDNSIYNGVSTSSLAIAVDLSNGSAGQYRCQISGDEATDVFTNSATITPSKCSTNLPPTIKPSSLSTKVKGKAVLDLKTIVSDVDNNIDITSLSILQLPVSNTPASIDNNGILTVDYTSSEFAGEDRITIQVCDSESMCAQQEITIIVSADIVMYNAVSPNADGKNDFLFIQYIDTLEETKKNKVTIFNRWGDVVFQVEDYDNTTRVFRGLSNNDKELVSGTYYYKIEFEGDRPDKSGFLYLKR
ncbi:ELWxxDGT repeat protein [Pseudochryseolinea flava]|uniref:Ig-like domain-containing protein n=1 Tax=Pseudochryseolinea flava TaxID=2059302 RepID=A0A364XUC5_9BACT|nr:ELWxxDGT repeat protein [Pseudochryseolinea flava]RAV97719.1 hypothetical protein DQQ10_27150 [Pseudochryseolinea flava]